MAMRVITAQTQVLKAAARKCVLPSWMPRWIPRRRWLAGSPEMSGGAAAVPVARWSALAGVHADVGDLAAAGHAPVG
jgi:hypothetical protein